MPFLSKSEPAEVSGHDLLAELDAATKSFNAQLQGITADARDRATVVESRLQELEAEKQILNQLAIEPVVFTGRAPQPNVTINQTFEAPVPDAPQA